MSPRRTLAFGTLASAILLLAAPGALAQPDPATSTCDVAVTQGPCPSPGCLAGAVKIARLCPGGPAWDTIIFRGVVRNAAGLPLPGVPVKPAKLAGTVNLTTGQFTMAVTNAAGEFEVGVRAGSGCGRLGVCAGNVFLNCSVLVRSPDVAGGPTPPGCPLPMAASFVNASDALNPACGFLSKFGPVGPANECYDLNCNGFVNASDVNGAVCPPFGLNGGLLQHFGHGGPIDMKNTCP